MFFNRELSQLEYCGRVLEEATLPDTPLLDKLKFLNIFTTLLDEFFMVRVAGLKKMQKEGFGICESPDQMPIALALEKVRSRASAFMKIQYECFHNEFLPKIKKERVNLVPFSSLSPKQKKTMHHIFLERIYPILTPLAVDSSHPAPFLNNLSEYLLIEFMGAMESLIGFVEIPSIISRLIPLETEIEGEFNFLLLEDLVQTHMNQLFLGLKITKCTPIRVTRNLDYTLLENKVVDLLESLQNEMQNRELQEVVRLEVCGELSKEVINKLVKLLNIRNEDVYSVSSPLFISGLQELYSLPLDHLKDAAFNPRIPAWAASDTRNIFSIIKEKDLLVHHPYESFYVVAEFINMAANDPQVLAIKQTLYRCSDDSPVIDSLIKASKNGKQVTAIVELKARFNEKSNILWSQRLESAGVNVVYGFVRLKTHSKACLVVRKEGDNIVRYVHLSSGNYNSQTAKLYSDIGLFTVWEEIAKDVSSLFNLLTGFNVLSDAIPDTQKETLPQFDQLYVAPINLRESFVKELKTIIEKQKNGKKTSISVKVNGLVDEPIIHLLYAASQAGTVIRLIVRGVCCLRPGVKGISENIQVISIVDRFLEHSRIYIFRSEDETRVFLGSADWMPRNLDRRVEIIYPIRDEDVKKRLIEEIFETSWKDNVKSRVLKSDGTYVLTSPPKDAKRIRSQTTFIALAREEGIKSIPYEKAIRYDLLKKKGMRPIAKRIALKKKGSPSSG
ncbi:MAG: polyphosphate kinase 1 [Deltaproteobacteria bacterium]|nr:polyphosphate kinase 1 [Deltaproteobacteria bacterium]